MAAVQKTAAPNSLMRYRNGSFKKPSSVEEERQLQAFFLVYRALFSNRSTIYNLSEIPPRNPSRVLSLDITRPAMPQQVVQVLGSGTSANTPAGSGVFASPAGALNSSQRIRGESSPSFPREAAVPVAATPSTARSGRAWFMGALVGVGVVTVGIGLLGAAAVGLGVVGFLGGGILGAGLLAGIAIGVGGLCVLGAIGTGVWLAKKWRQARAKSPDLRRQGVAAVVSKKDNVIKDGVDDVIEVVTPGVRAGRRTQNGLPTFTGSLVLPFSLSGLEKQMERNLAHQKEAAERIIEAAKGTTAAFKTIIEAEKEIKKSVTRLEEAVTRQEEAVEGIKKAVTRQEAALTRQEAAVEGIKKAVTRQEAALACQEEAVEGIKKAVTRQEAAVTRQEAAVDCQEKTESQLLAKVNDLQQHLQEDNVKLDKMLEKMSKMQAELGSTPSEGKRMHSPALLSKRGLFAPNCAGEALAKERRCGGVPDAALNIEPVAGLVAAA